jgi:NADH-quinone oxidoreductase subunit J
MSTTTTIAILIAAALGGVGTFLLLPHRLGKNRPRAWRVAGALLALLATLALASLWTAPSAFLAGLFFYGLSLLAIAGALLMVTSRNPVYSALWFAMVVLSTSGLYLLAGAQFLAAGTVIVYAGAIIVTFLFVIMLAQSEGNALYDRLARSPGRTSLVAFALLGGLVYAILAAADVPVAADVDVANSTPLAPSSSVLSRVDPIANPAPHRVMARSLSQQNRLFTEASAAESPGRAIDGFPPPHVAGLGATLYTDHLLSVEIAGAILFVALVGAAAIATPRPPVRPGQADRPATR